MGTRDTTDATFGQIDENHQTAGIMTTINSVT